MAMISTLQRVPRRLLRLLCFDKPTWDGVIEIFKLKYKQGDIIPLTAKDLIPILKDLEAELHSQDGPPRSVSIIGAALEHSDADTNPPEQDTEPELYISVSEKTE
ncbi:hypothetical protein BJX70DRAFT_395362 [Aspergillus crustosus]